MSSSKRQRSPSGVIEASRLRKSARGLSDSASEIQTDEQHGKSDGTVRILIRLGSARKAIRNDPRPPLTPEDWRRILAGLEESSNTANLPGNVREERSSGDAQSVSDGTRSVLEDMDEAATPQNDLANTIRNETSPPENVDEEDDAEGIEDVEDEDGEGLEDSDGDSYYSDDEHRWLEQIYGTATLHPSVNTSAPHKSNVVGRCMAQLVRRYQITDSFWFEMEEPASQTAELAFELFDRYGRLDREYYEHEIRKGTGVWGKELNRGDLLLFDNIEVDKDWRRQGYATKLVNAILEKTRGKVDEQRGFFAVVCLGWLNPEIDSEDHESIEQGELTIIWSFWRSLGFRRIGTSRWFARSDDPNHPSRSLEPARDWDPPHRQEILPPAENIMDLFDKLADPAMEDLECLNNLQKTLPEDSGDPQWLTVDQDGNNVLHIAAMLSKPRSVQFILSKHDHLAAERNIEGYTPLEALRNVLEQRRTREKIMATYLVRSDEFCGFAEPSIECLAALQGISPFDLSTLSIRDLEAVAGATDEQVRRLPQIDVVGIRKTLRLKYGCTCGQCLGGFLSPRMKFVLLCAAEIEHDMLNSDMEESGPFWCLENQHRLTYLPDRVRENLKTNKSMRQGFTNMCDHFAECLRRGRIPSAAEVLDVFATFRSEWPPVTRNFLDRGGSVASVATMLFRVAMERDEWTGDSEDMEVFGGDIDALPECRNDHEFGFVAGMCGYKRVAPQDGDAVDPFWNEED